MMEELERDGVERAIQSCYQDRDAMLNGRAVLSGLMALQRKGPWWKRIRETLRRWLGVDAR